MVKSILTGDGSIELEDYFDYSTGQKALLMLETFEGTRNNTTTITLCKKFRYEYRGGL